MPKYEKHAEKAIQDLLNSGFRSIGEYKGSQQPWLVQCLKCNFEFITTHFKVRRGDLKNCPNCRIKSEKKFAIEAEGIMRAAGLSPLTPYPGRNSAPWACICDSCGARTSPAFATVKNGGGCKFCGIKSAANSKKIDPDFAEEVMLKSLLRPLEPYSSARKPWKCECLRCGSVVRPTYNAIQQGEGGCRFCGRKNASEKTRLDTRDAVSLMRTKGYEPLEEFVNSHTGWRCRCLVCGRAVSPSYSNVARRQKSFGCIFCMGGRVSPEDAVKVMEAAGVIPQTSYPGKDLPWESICVKCGRKVTPTYSNARRGQGGCKFCAEHGIDLVAPAYLYVVQHPIFNAYKVGIGKIGGPKNKDRIVRLARNGWELLRKYEYETGLEAQGYEYQFFKVVRNQLEIPIYLSAEDMKQTAGHTETMDADLISVMQIFKIIEEIHQKSLA